MWVAVSDLDLSPRSEPAAVDAPGSPLGADRRARPRARRRRRDRHPVPALGGRLLLQRRRDRPARRLRAGPAPARPGHGRPGHGRHRRRRHDVHHLLRRRHDAGALPGAARRDLRGVPASRRARRARRATRSKGTASRSSTPTSTRPRTPIASTAAPAESDTCSPSRRATEAAWPGNAMRARPGRADAHARRGDVRCDGDGPRHPARRPPHPADGADLRLALPRRGCARRRDDAAGTDHTRLLIVVSCNKLARTARRRSTTSPRCGRRSRGRSCCGW